MSETDNHQDNLKAGYQQICDSYRAIDDFRTKLLGLLPLATGTGVVVLLGTVADPKNSSIVQQLVGPIATFGSLITVGLFAYELHGIKKCGYLIRAGQHVEGDLGIDGQFRSRPHEVAGFMDEPFSASVIYPASLAAWTYLALAFKWPVAALGAATVVFIVACSASLWLIRRMEQDLTMGDPEYDLKRMQSYTHEPNIRKIFRSVKKRMP